MRTRSFQSGHLVTAAMVSAVAVGASLAVAATPGRASASTTGGPMLQDAVDALHALGISGIQAHARDGRQHTWARAGLANLNTGEPVPGNGHFRMGTTTMTFTAVVVLQLVGEGRLSLDDPVERWLPGLVAGNGNDGNRVSVRHLLQHFSGINDYTPGLAAVQSLESFLAHRYDHFEPADLVAIAMAHAPAFAPGTRWRFSGTNYVLAGLVVEAVTGRPLATELQDRIFGPLNLTQTSMPGDRAELPTPHARSYKQFVEDGPMVDTTEFNPTVGYAASDLVSTPRNLLEFLQALRGGRLLAAAEQAEMHTTVPAPGIQHLPGARYGLGIMWIPNRCGGYWSHLGAAPGSSTLSGVTDDGRRAVVLSLTTHLAEHDVTVDEATRSLRLIDDALCGPACANR